MLLLSHFLFTDKDVLCIRLTQSSPDQTVASGSEVTLLCTYDGNSPNPDLFWYRKRLDNSLEFILYRDDTRSHDADFVQGRFSVKHIKAYSTFHLVISPVRLEDSATYYCASGSHCDAGAQGACTQTLEHSLGVPLLPHESHMPGCQASGSQVTRNKRPGHGQGKLWLPRSTASLIPPSSPESLVVGYGELQLEIILYLCPQVYAAHCEDIRMVRCSAEDATVGVFISAVAQSLLCISRFSC